MPQIYFHIGAPKTGTSFLQHSLVLNADKLVAENEVTIPYNFHGVEYGHNYLNLALSKKVFPGNASWIFFSEQKGLHWIDIFLQQIEKRNNVLISSELFFNWPHLTSRVCEKFAERGFETKIVAYLPNFKKFLFDSYKQNVADLGYRGTFVEFVRLEPEWFGRFSKIYIYLNNISQSVEITFIKKPDLFGFPYFKSFLNDFDLEFTGDFADPGIVNESVSFLSFTKLLGGEYCNNDCFGNLSESGKISKFLNTPENVKAIREEIDRQPTDFLFSGDTDLNTFLYGDLLGEISFD